MAPRRAQKVRLKDRRRTESYLSLALYGILAFAVIGGSAYVARMPQFSINQVVVGGVEYADETKIQESVEGVLSGTYAFLIPKRLSYLVPQGALTATVLESFPLVQSTNVTREGQKLVVTVVEREPKALWCADACYSMDAYGFIFDVARGEDLRVYRGLVETPIGATYLDGGFQDFHRLVDRIAEASGRAVSSVVVDELDAFVMFSGGGELRFSRGAESERLIADVASIFGSNAFRDSRPFNYIELRFGPKAVVKFD